MYAVVDDNGYVVDVCNTWEEAEQQTEMYPFFTRVQELDDFFEEEEIG